MIAGIAPPIVTLGDAAIDVFVSTPNGVVSGSDAAGTVRLQAGGSAANVAVWLARLGAAATFVGAVGDDFSASYLRADLERENVTLYLQTLPISTAAIAVLLDDRGERTMITDRAAAQQLSSGFIEPSMLPAGCRLHLPAYSLFDHPLVGAALKAADICRRRGGSVAVDASSVGPLQAYGRDRFLQLLEALHPDVLFANQAEAAFLSDSSRAEQGSVVLRQFAATVVWKLGASGAAARTDGYCYVPGLPVEAVDSTGAGDAFAAAFTYAQALGRTVHAALTFANRVAAAVVQRIGARPRFSIDALLEMRQGQEEP